MRCSSTARTATRRSPSACRTSTRSAARSASNRVQRVGRTNILEPEFDLSSEREGYRWRSARVGKAIGASQIGATVYELPDGERTYPYHFHNAIEEWLVVLAGTPTLRDSGGERVLARGDVVCFPTGAE